MHAMTEKQIRRSFVNCSRGEAMGITMPRDFDAFAWDEAEFLGWRDAKAPLRGYVVLWRNDAPLGIALRAADSTMSSQKSAMCLLCQSAQSAANVSLFSAKRAGESGRHGNTIGQYICADLACSRRVRTEIPPWLRERDPEEVVFERAAELELRLNAFVDHVMRP